MLPLFHAAVLKPSQNDFHGKVLIALQPACNGLLWMSGWAPRSPCVTCVPPPAAACAQTCATPLHICNITLKKLFIPDSAHGDLQ